MAVKITPFITAYGPKNKCRWEDDGSPCLVEQSHKETVDINRIMAKYQRTGAIDHVKKHGPEYGSMTSLDLKTAMDTLIKAETMFMELPSKVRKRFDNDAAKFLDFVQDDANREEAGALGLLTVDAMRELAAAKAAELANEAAAKSPPGDIGGSEATPPA